ncbi:hypothetical protein NDU88_006646 [Pleurodeles waltl]|uniref:Uncharacterized protein n=1 Tax=Pleurodeles waltl TaxID=8319 RepID=A0AAV7QKL4_PLEWA|nr:hypothetical protein NDU88_006646 [Pleurodeles waltl]
MQSCGGGPSPRALEWLARSERSGDQYGDRSRTRPVVAALLECSFYPHHSTRLISAGRPPSPQSSLKTFGQQQRHK